MLQICCQTVSVLKDIVMKKNMKNRIIRFCLLVLVGGMVVGCSPEYDDNSKPTDHTDPKPPTRFRFDFQKEWLHVVTNYDKAMEMFVVEKATGEVIRRQTVQDSAQVHIDKNGIYTIYLISDEERMVQDIEVKTRQ